MTSRATVAGATLLCLWLSSPIANAASIGVWTVDSMTRVFREQPARPRIEPQLSAARGEWEAFQVVLTGTPEQLTGAKLTTTFLSGPKGATIPPPSIFREHYVRVTTSSPQTSLPAGDYPDALVPQSFAETPLPKLDLLNQPFWVDLYVPYAQTAGDYRGLVTITLKNGHSETLPFNLKVHPFDLPVVPTMRSSFWLGWRRVAEVHGFDKTADYPTPELEALLDDYAGLLAEHRLSIDQIRQSYPDAKTGQLDKAAVELALRRHLLHRHAASIGLPIFPTWPFHDPLGRDRIAAQQYLGDWMKILNRFRCGDRGYIALGDLDEPNDAPAYERVRQWGHFINEAERRHGVRLPLMITEQPTPDQPEWGALDGAVDIWVPHFSAVYEDMESPNGKRDIARRLAAGEQVWTYAALVQLGEGWKERHQFPQIVSHGHPPVWMIDYPPINHRILPWLMHLHGITGLTYWDVLHYPPDVDPWTNAGTFRGGNETFNGDGFYLYPATNERHGQNMPVASIRLKWLRSAAQDFDYLTLAHRAGFSAQARQLTATFAKGFGDWQDDVPALLAAREQIAHLLSQPSRPNGDTR